MQNFTLPAYIQDRTDRPALVGVTIFMQLGPLLLLSIPGGVLADKVSKQKLQLAMQAASAILTLFLAFFVARDAALLAIFGTQFAIGVANALNAPAFQASMPLLVHRKDLPGAISLNSAMINGSRVMGPVLAAVLASAGMSTAQIFIVNAGTYVFFIVALLIARMPDVRGTFVEVGWRRLLTGTNIVRDRAVLNFGFDPLGNSYRALYATWGFGAFFGAISVGTWLSDIRRHTLIVRGFTAFAIALGIFSQLRDGFSPYPVGFVLGFAYFMTATAITTELQLNLKDTERASVMPLWFMAFGGTVPIGNLVFGVVIEWVGARAVLGFGAVFALFLAYWVDLRQFTRGAFLAEQDGGEKYTPVNASRFF